MSYLYGFISVIASVILALITGIPIISDWGLAYFHFEYFMLGFVAPTGYYYFVFNKEKAFKKQHILPGLSLGILALLVIMLIHYFVLLDILFPFLTYLNIVKLEILVFLFASILLPLVKIVGQIKCKKCSSGYFTEELLFKVSNDDYRKDIKKFIQFAANKSEDELINFINERRFDTGYSSKIRGKKTSTYSFYLITCNNCRNQYIVSEKNKENSEEVSVSKKHSYKIIANINQCKEVQVD